MKQGCLKTSCLTNCDKILNIVNFENGGPCKVFQRDILHFMLNILSISLLSRVTDTYRDVNWDNISFLVLKKSSMIFLFMLRLNVPVNNFFSHVGIEPALPVYYQYFRGVKCLAQRHNTAEVCIEPPPPDLSLRSPTLYH